MSVSPRDPHAIKAMSPDLLVAEFRPLVGSIVSKLRRELRIRVSPEDLEAYAFEGLLEAQTRFDPETGTYFSTFAYYRIRGSVLDGCRKEGWLGRSQDYRRAQAMGQLLESTAETEQGSPEARALGDAVDRVKNLVDCAVVVFLLCDEDLDGVAAEPPTQHSELESARDREALRAAFSVLTDEERQVVQRHHYDGARMDEIAQDFGRSKSWVSRINARALEKMKRYILKEEQP